MEGQGRFASTTRLSGDDRQHRRRLTADGQLSYAGRFADTINWQVYYQDSETDQRTIEDRVASARAPAPTRRFPGFEFSQRTLGADFSATRRLCKGRSNRTDFFTVHSCDSTRPGNFGTICWLTSTTAAATKTILGETFPVRDFPTSRHHSRLPCSLTMKSGSAKQATDADSGDTRWSTTNSIRALMMSIARTIRWAVSCHSAK